MKLTIDNPNNIVSSAFIRRNDLSFSLFINTVEKWVKFNHYESSSTTLTWVFQDHSMPDKVMLIAESDNDKEIISRVQFLQHCKDQIHILLPAKEVIELNLDAECPYCESIRLNIDLWRLEQRANTYGMAIYADRAITVLQFSLDECENRDHKTQY